MERFLQVAQSNSMFIALGKLILVVHSVMMPVAFGGAAIRSKSLTAMAHLKSIVEVKGEENCLVHALIIARLNNEPNYKAYKQGWKKRVRPVIQQLLKKNGVDLNNGAVIPELLASVRL